MARITVGVHELKKRLRRYLGQAVTGDTGVIADRGQTVPPGSSADGRLRQAAATGLIAWNGRKPGHASPLAHCHGSRTVADRLLEDRE